MVRSLPNSYKLKSSYLNENSSTIETLILGSSHTFYGVNSKYIHSKSFNASNVSQSPDVDFAILNSYENQLSNIKTVVIRLSYDTLFEQLKNSSEDWRLKDYKLYTEVNFDYSYKHYSELLTVGTRQSFKVLFNRYFKNKSLLNCDSLGWGNDLYKKPNIDLNNAGLVAAKRHTAKDWNLLNDNIKIYEKITKWCQNRNIKVILVTLPAYVSYRNNLNRRQLSKMIDVGNYLDSKYANCSYFNFLSDENFLKEDFYDADHLNKIGAQKFSRLINNLIEN